jgi:hypothetical protein
MMITTLKTGIKLIMGVKQKTRSKSDRVLFTVRKKGLEPPRLAAPDPKSGAATNYATSALGFCEVQR